MVGSIEAKYRSDTRWEIVTESGRENTGIELNEWMVTLKEKGVGEIFITSVDNEGTRKGLDVKLANYIQVTEIPIIFCGGFNNPENIHDLMAAYEVQGIAIADYLHYERGGIIDIKKWSKKNSINVR